MRVVVIVHDLGIGGTQRVAENYARALSKLGHAVCVFAYSGDGPRRATLEAAGIRVLVGAERGNLEASLQTIVEWDGELVQLHRTGRPNAIESQIIERLAAAGMTIFETNVFGEFDHSLPPGAMDLHLHLTAWSYHRWWKRSGGRARRENATILPNAVDEEGFLPLDADERGKARQDLGLPPASYLFGRIGQPIESKWHVSTVDAFLTVARARPDAALLLVGAPDNIRRRVDALPADVRPRVLVRTTTSDDQQLRQFYGSLDCFIHTARIGESFGMVLCEALMMGVPIVTLATPLRDNSQTEIVGHERFGMVALHEEDLPTAMLRVMTEPQWATLTRSSARAWVIESYGSLGLAKRLVAMAESIRSNRVVEVVAYDDVLVSVKAVLVSGIGRIGLIDRLGFHVVDTMLYNLALDLYRKARGSIKRVRRPTG